MVTDSFFGALPRRGIIGVRFAESPENRGVVVTELTHPLAAQAAGVAVGDVLLSCDDHEFRDVSAFRQWASRLKAHSHVSLLVQRGTERLLLTVHVQPAKGEQAEGVHSHYSSVQMPDGARLRTIFTVGTALQPRAVIFVLPGYSLASWEWANHPSYPLRLWVEDLARAGFAVLRVERRNCGESDHLVDEHGVAIDRGFEGELRDYAHVHEQLMRGADLHAPCDVRALPWVLYGYSLGGLQAIRLGPTVNASAIAVWGSGCDTWTEYSEALLRRRMGFEARSEAEIELAVRALQSLQSTVLVAGETIAQWRLKYPQWAPWSEWLGVGDHEQIHGRSAQYWREVYQCPCTQPLMDWTRPLLALRGESDCVTFAHEHERIARMAAKGEFRPVAEVDHEYVSQPSMQASYARNTPGLYSPEPAKMLVDWLMRESIALLR